MANEVKEILEEKKTVGTRIELAKGIHRKARKIHNNEMPRSFTFANTCEKLIEEAVAARIAKKETSLQ